MSAIAFLDVVLDVQDFGDRFIDFEFPVKLGRLLQEDTGLFHIIRLYKTGSGYYFKHLTRSAGSSFYSSEFMTGTVESFDYAKVSIQKYIAELMIKEGLA